MINSESAHLLCIECKQEFPYIPLHTNRCFFCITKTEKPNKLQNKLCHAYCLSAGNKKMAKKCHLCLEFNVMNIIPIYKRLYREFDEKILTPLYGSLLCCECVINLANDKEHFKIPKKDKDKDKRQR